MLVGRKKPIRPRRVFDKSFWLLIVALLSCWQMVTVSAASQKYLQSAFSNHDQELKNANNCKNLCGHCSGLGFYCGEECICECNDDRSDTECISSIQSNARKLKIPFEILIQGPSSNRLVRNAYQFEQNVESKSFIPPINREMRNKRSTVVIYKPAAQNSLHDASKQKLKSPKSINKRSVEQLNEPFFGTTNLAKKRPIDRLDWFTDFANTLVRPAPLGGRKNEVEPSQVEDAMHRKRTTPLLDRSWFTDNTNLLLKPAPHFKRQSFDFEDSEETQGLTMEKLPKVLKDAIGSIRETAINEDFGDALRSKIREGKEALQTHLADSSFDVFPKNIFTPRVSEQFMNVRPSPTHTEAPTTVASVTSPAISLPKVSLPWFRPMRFLQRVQQSIN